MGLFDDLAMGFGLKPKTQDFVDRTAKTIERTQGSDRAATYSNQMSNKGFENNYTPSEGSVAVVQQSSNDDNKSLPSIQKEMPVASEPATQTTTTMQDPEMPDEGLDMTGPDFGGLLNTDYTTYNSDKFVGFDTTSGGNTIGYASSGDYAGYMAIVRPDGNVEILAPGSKETGIIFEGDNRVDAAINYLTGTGTASGESIFMSDFDRQDKNNLLKLKRLEVLGAIALENQENNNVYDAAFDLNEDGKVSLFDISKLNMMYAGPTGGGTQRTQKFADLFAMDVNPNTSNQTSNLADGLTAPTAASASINPDNGYIDITFNGLGGQAVTVSGRTMEEARANARDHGDGYITNLIAELNDTGTLTDQQRQDLRNAIGWKATFNPDGTQPYNAYTQLDSSSVGLNDAASQLNQFEIDNLLIPTFSADPYTGSQSSVNISGVYNSIINDDSISDDAKRYALASVMSPTLTDLDLQKYDLSGDGVISQEDTGIAQTNYLTQNNAIVQNPNATNVWEFSSAYNVNPDEQYVNFNQSGTGNSIAQTNIGELFQDGNTYKFRTKDGIIAKEFTDLQDAIRFVSPNAGYEFGKFSNQFQQYDSYEPYYYTSNSGIQMGLSTSELATIDDLRSQGFTTQQINERLKSMYDYRRPVTDTTPIDMGSSSQFISKPDRQDAEYQTTDPYNIYTRDESTDQQAGVFQAQPNQPQFIGAYTGQVNPVTGTYTVMEPMQASRPSVGGITTGVMGTQQQQQTTLPLTNTGYGPRFMNEGGVVPQQQQMQPQGTFGGFKPQAMQRIAGSLGYTGDMSGFDQYLNANPDKKQKMDMYTQQAIQMAKGGMPKKVLHAQNGTYVEGQSDPRVLGQQYIPQQDFTVQDGQGYSLQDVMSMQAVYPGLPEGATVTPTGVQFTGGQFVNPYSGQVYGNAAVPTQLASTTYAAQQQATGANLMRPTTGFGAINQLMGGVAPAQMDPTQMQTVQAAQGQSNLNVQAAQGQAYMMTNPVQRQLQAGELISGAADASKAAQFTEQIEAAQAEPSEKATVQGQLEGLMQQFEGGDTPAWAAGAMRAAMGAMAARGLGASSLSGQAVVQAAMESALPIASADAQTVAAFEQQNLSNKQQRAMLAAQQRAQFMGQEFDQAFQARVANASKVSDIANMNFTAEQQVALENSRAANTMNLANLNNRQAGIMAEAAAIANMDMANLSNRQQAAVQNAQNFLQVDMANLSNRQQTELFQAQQRSQALFTDQAAENAAAQFNASSQNQVDQFFASLASQTSQFNASQANAQSQFNAGQVNTVERFNAEINNQREQFNAQNRLIIDQSNAQWRREVATMDTAAVNRANELNAEALLGYSRDAYNNLWQYYRDNMEWAWTSAEGEKNRMNNLAIAHLNHNAEYDLTKMKQDYESTVGFGSLIGKILTSDLEGTLGDSILGSWFGFG